MLCAGGGGEDGGEAIAPEADDIAGERGEIAKQGVEAVHRERFALGRVELAEPEVNQRPHRLVGHLTVTAVPLVLRGWAGRIDRVQPALAARNGEDRRRFGLSWVSAARRSSQPHSEPL